MELAHFAKDVGMQDFAEYFNQMKEIVTAPTLSKEGFLIRQATTQRKEFSDATPKSKKQNKGWFKKKDQPVSEY